LTSEQLDKILKEITFEHSYHEDSHRYPRDFWHVRASLGSLSTDWYRYGKQEKYERVPEEIKEAEHEVLQEVINSIRFLLD
jgi:signal recognition particle subunit SEC65